MTVYFLINNDSPYNLSIHMHTCTLTHISTTWTIVWIWKDIVCYATGIYKIWVSFLTCMNDYSLFFLSCNNMFDSTQVFSKLENGDSFTLIFLIWKFFHLLWHIVKLIFALRVPKLSSLMFKTYLRSIYSFKIQISLIFYQSFEEATSGNINDTERETFSKQLKA